MKIIDNIKDYYDYLVGTYGLDNTIVYDRRNSGYFYDRKWRSLYFDHKKKCWTLSDYTSWLYDYEKVFYKEIIEKPKNFSNIYYDIPEKVGKEPKGNTFVIDLAIGDKVFHIVIDRYLKNKELVIDKFDFKTFERDWYESKWDDLLKEYPLYANYNDSYILPNPILKGSILSKYFTADFIWNQVYNYLSSLKDPKIVDSRTDIEKLESAGFDKKTSFRKM